MSSYGNDKELFAHVRTYATKHFRLRNNFNLLNTFQISETIKGKKVSVEEIISIH